MMIKERIDLALYNSYNVLDWEKALIERCIEDNPSSTAEELAQLLNLSVRTLYRKCQDYKLKLPKGPESNINRGLGNKKNRA